MSVVGSETGRRSREVEADVGALSSSRCAATRVWKSQAGWEVCSRAWTSIRQRMSAAALSCPGKRRMYEVSCAMKLIYQACLGECLSGRVRRANVRGLWSV